MPSSGPVSPVPSTWRAVLTPSALSRLAGGWLAVLLASITAPLLHPPVAAPLLISALAVIIGVILWCAFGVVHEAEALARRLGDPYGTLILTLSIVVIEVILIASVMLGPGEHTSIARDSVMAVSMIILNLVVGVCLVVSGLRYGNLPVNRVGTSAYLVMLTVLIATGFALPAVIGTDGIFGPGQAIVVAALTVGLYAGFLWLQTGAQADDFREAPGIPPTGAGHEQTSPSGPLARAVGAPSPSDTTAQGAGSSSLRDAGTSPDHDTGEAAHIEQTPAETQSPRRPIGDVVAEHRTELLARSALLVVMVLPIVLLAQHMAGLLDDGLGRLGAPVALAGVLIAMIVFTPETLTAVRAALGGESQRVVNLCHGALVSTVGLTIPTVLVISLLTGQQVMFAESPANLLLLAVTLGVSGLAGSSPRVGAVHGAVHLMLFAIYGLALFS